MAESKSEAKTLSAVVDISPQAEEENLKEIDALLQDSQKSTEKYKADTEKKLEMIKQLDELLAKKNKALADALEQRKQKAAENKE